MNVLRSVVAGVTLALAVSVPARFAGASGPSGDVIGEALSLSGYTVQELSIPAAAGAPFGVAVQLGGVQREIAFVPHSVRAEGFGVLIQDGSGALHQIDAPAETTYRGTIAGLEGAVASASLTGAGLTGLVRLPGEQGVWGIQPVGEVIPGSARALHVVYRESDGVPGGWGCGVGQPNLSLPALKGMAGGGGSPDGMLVCQLACDADFEFYTSWGSNATTVTNDITGVVNAVSNIYEVDCQIELQITQIIIRTSAATNPYTSSTPGTLLGQFRSYWLANHAAVPRDLAHLFTGRNLDGSVIGIAYLQGICNTNAYGLSQSRFTANFAFRAGLTAHETGHNFSAQHCDSICSPCEIMCSGIGGCAGIVTSFSTCDIASITSYAATKPCLAPPPPPVLSLPFFDPFPGPGVDASKWPVNNGGVITSSAQNERSAPNSLVLFQTMSIESAPMNTEASGPPVFISLWTQPLFVEAGKELRVKYLNPTSLQFEPLMSIVSDGTNPSRFAFSEAKLPLFGLSTTNSKIRLEGAGTQSDDTWFIDDVGVSLYCRADINKDRALTVSDFGAFQTAFVAGDLMVADFNDDGVLSVADFGTYQTKFVQGCY